MRYTKPAARINANAPHRILTTYWTRDGYRGEAGDDVYPTQAAAWAAIRAMPADDAVRSRQPTPVR